MTFARSESVTLGVGDGGTRVQGAIALSVQREAAVRVAVVLLVTRARKEFPDMIRLVRARGPAAGRGLEWIGVDVE